MIHPLLAKAQASSLLPTDNRITFDIGDTVDVHLKVKEGDKERIQIFSGIVIARRGAGTDENFTVRRIVDNEGVERIFPIHSPKIEKVEIKKRAVVRRAKLYYLRDRVGKRAFTLKEKPTVKETTGRKRTRVKARKEKVEQEVAAKAADPNTRDARKQRRRAKGKKPEGAGSEGGGEG